MASPMSMLPARKTDLPTISVVRSGARMTRAEGVLGAEVIEAGLKANGLGFERFSS